MLCYELVNKVEIKIEVIDSDKGELLLLLQILPIEIHNISQHRIKYLLNKCAIDLSHIICNLLDIAHEPLDIVNIFLPLSLVILRVIG